MLPATSSYRIRPPFGRIRYPKIRVSTGASPRLQQRCRGPKIKSWGLLHPPRPSPTTSTASSPTCRAPATISPATFLPKSSNLTGAVETTGFGIRWPDPANSPTSSADLSGYLPPDHWSLQDVILEAPVASPTTTTAYWAQSGEIISFGPSMRPWAFHRRQQALISDCASTSTPTYIHRRLPPSRRPPQRPQDLVLGASVASSASDEASNTPPSTCKLPPLRLPPLLRQLQSAPPELDPGLSICSLGSSLSTEKRRSMSEEKMMKRESCKRERSCVDK